MKCPYVNAVFKISYLFAFFSIFELHQDRRFGIFQNCDHIFCIKCVQSWIMTGLCPICLKISPYVIPSEYWIEESDEKSLFFDSFVEKTPKKDYS